MKIRTIYPIYPPLRFDSDVSVEIYRSLVRYFATEREIVVRGDTSHDGERLFVRAKKFTKAEEKHLNRESPWKIQWMLEFFGTFKFPGSKNFNLKDHKGKIIPTSARELKSLWKSFFAT